MDFEKLRKMMCEEEVYQGHPDTQAVDVSQWRHLPEVKEALENPSIRYGRGYCLPDGVYMWPGGKVEAHETRLSPEEPEY